jgi:hypothetical protein
MPVPARLGLALDPYVTGDGIAVDIREAEAAA